MNLPADAAKVTVENGFAPTKALDIRRFFMYGADFIRIHGTTVVSLEGEQTVTEDCVVMFDDFGKLIGYPASQKAFSKYEIESHIEGAEGKAIKRDATEYLSKKMDAPFSAVIWNGDVVSGKEGDYLVANVANSDFRIVAAEIFKDSYAVL